MIPNNDVLSEVITEPVYYGKTYRIVFGNDMVESRYNNGILQMSMEVDIDECDRISGFIDGLESVIQSVYLILSTERYQYIIYSWDYGVELLDLFGKPLSYVMAELPRRITEALTQDNRIKDVVDFEFEKQGSKLHTTFTVVTDLGKISTAMEVAI